MHEVWWCLVYTRMLRAGLARGTRSDLIEKACTSCGISVELGFAVN
jgi:hypothetical protein